MTLTTVSLFGLE